ncbi:MAG: OmpH family outer membrane protein [Verrucomicrobia bacterium]|nr:OmpH family outer membrane protein [Verrucomicrobiota bacterium]
MNISAIRQAIAVSRLLFGFGLALVLAGQALYAQMDDVKFGSVNMRRLYEEFYKTKLAQRSFDESVAAYRKDYQQRVNDNKSLDALKEFEQNSQKYLNDLRRRQNDAILSEILKAIRKKGRDDGYTVIVDSSGFGTVASIPMAIYAEEKLDFTDMILKELNANAQPMLASITREEIEESIERDLNANGRPQKWFDFLHPIGTAKKIKVYEVKRQKNGDKITGVTIRFTLYWESPITKDGWTKVKSFYDCETERYTNEIEKTNGTTNSDVGNFLKDFAVGFGAGVLDGLLRNQQN